MPPRRSTKSKKRSSIASANVFIATSLDGFIARDDGSIDWLNDGGGSAAVQATDGGDYGYTSFFETVDALVMGRNTFELVRTFPTWPYGKTPVIVLTTRPLKIPKELAKNVETMSGTAKAIADRLASRDLTQLYVDGGKTIQAFLDAGLVRRLIITRIPILLGSGIPLFGKLRGGDIRLRHVATRTFSSGLVQSEYEVVPK